MILGEAKILIADDEECLLRILSHNILKWGARVVVARNGAEAFDVAMREKPDLILSDYQMPVLDGMGFCAKLRACAETAQIPVVMLTARGHRVDEQEMKRLAIATLLAKPFSVREIKAKLEEVLAAVGAVVAA